MSAGPILIMAGGTGGHIYPGLAVAEVLRARGEPVVWVGTPGRLEERIVPAHGYEIEWISIKGLRGRGVLATVLTPFRVLRAIVQVLGVFRRRRPACVLGMGGYVSGPGGIAAWLARKPLVIHEQNAVAGTTNRLLSRFARRIFAAFPDAFARRSDVVIVGNPVRAEIEQVGAARASANPRASKRLLVLGGSQGANVLNRVVPDALSRLPKALQPSVIHQTGASIDAARVAYASAGIDAELRTFIDDMAGAYSGADLVIARAGALTVAELEAAGIGAVLVPYPHAIDDHQTRNAEHFCAGGAGIIIAESKLDAAGLAAILEPLLDSPGRLEQMGRTARAQARSGAAQRIAEACLELAGAGA